MAALVEVAPLRPDSGGCVVATKAALMDAGVGWLFGVAGSR